MFKGRKKKALDDSGKKRTLQGAVRYWVLAVSVIAALYHLYTARFGTPVAIQHRSIHVAFVLVLIFTIYPFLRKKSLWVNVFDGVLVVLAVIPTYYLIANFQEIVYRAGMPNNTDIIMGAILLVLVLEAGRRVMGWVLPILAGIFILYAYYGSLIGGYLGHRGFYFKEIIEYMYLTTEGIYGIPIGVSAQYLVLFIIFGAFLLKSGVGDFFTDLAIAIAGKRKGGPAQVAVISSGLMGSINGAAIANVATTGSFTIPLMKRIGYSKEFAGGVEAAASCGGQILPPVMGAAAFIMAETLGIEYVNIMYAAIIPALLYYSATMAMVYLRASRKNLSGMDASEVPDLKQLLKSKAYLFIPLVALVFFLVSGYTPTYAAFFAILSTVVVSWFNREHRMGLKEIIEALELGFKNALSVAIACAVVGIVVGVSTMTGFGSKLAGSIINWSGGNLLLTLLFTMIACIILGLGMPSIPAYILTATMAAPALGKLGVEPVVAHFFVFYFAMMANVTPPVALAAFAAAGISGGDVNKTGVAAFKLASAGFLIPYMFVLNPSLLGISDSLVTVLLAAVTAFAGVLSLAGGLEGWLLTRANLLQRIMLLAGALFLIKPGGVTDFIGFALIGAVLVMQKYTISANYEAKA